MSNKQPDRDVNYMRNMWGTTKLVTDYSVSESRVLSEITYDSAPKVSKVSNALIETETENEFEYGIEPTYKNKMQNLL